MGRRGCCSSCVDEGEFLFPGERFDAEFFFGGFGAGADFTAVNDFEREFAAEVFGALGALGEVFFEAAVDVGGDAGVEGAVSATEDIERPSGWGHLMGRGIF